MPPIARRSLASFFLVASMAAANAATFNVTSTADSGAGTLRQAVLDANASPGPDQIAFSLPGCPCTITLASTIAITDATSIAGPGPGNLLLSGGNAVRILTTGAPPVSISGLGIAFGAAPGDGGAILAAGPLDLADVTINGNTGGNGGGIFAQFGLTVTDSRFENNVAQNGGAIYAHGPVVIQNSTFQSNSAPVFFGGAVYVTGPLTVTGSSFLGNNSAAGGGVFGTTSSAIQVSNSNFSSNTTQHGGAIRGDGSVNVTGGAFIANSASFDGGAIIGAFVTLDGTLFDGNSATNGSGGAVVSNGAILATNATFTGNQAAGGGAVASRLGNGTFTGCIFMSNGASVSDGGAISVEGTGTLEIVDSTFSANTSANQGGALWLYSGAAFSILRTTFDGNQAGLVGGAISKFSVQPLVIDRSTLRGNLAGAAFASGRGGAIHVSGGDVAVRNSLLASNSAASSEGNAVSHESFGLLSVVHTTIANGGVTRTNSALSVLAGTIDLANSIVADHATALTLAVGSATPNRVLVWNTSGPAPAFAVQGAATINTSLVTTGDPVFANAGGGDYHLGAGSAAIDLSPNARESVDFDGESRPQGSGHDAGFDERAPGAQSITFGSLAGRTFGEAPFGITASASSGLDVALASSTPAVCTVSGSTVTIVATGTCTITANQAGNASWLAATQVTQSFTVAKAAQTITFGALGNRPIGEAPFAVSASASSGLPVTFSSATAGTCTVSGFTVTLLATGTCTVAADQPGNGNFLAAAQVTRSFTVTSTNPPRLANIATRMQVLTGADVMIGGFIVGGSQTKTVVVRARGPSLTALGVPGALADPLLQLFVGPTQIAVNDNWREAANQAAIQASGFAPSNDLESAFIASLAPGPYTAIVSGVGGGTGVGIIEVFEVDQPQVPLLNIATRGKVLTGDDVMIGGFIIQGDGPQTVIVRARGPSLAAQGVPGTLQDPVLQLFSGQAVIASNDDWQSSPDASTIQAAGFAPSDTRESVIRITLNPGAYTAIVTGKNGTTGVGIIEVFAQ